MENNEKLAREWAEEHAETHLKQGCDCLTEQTVAAVEFILVRTAPPTMADVEWDDEEHYLAGAVDRNGNDAVMLHKCLNNTIRVCDADSIGRRFVMGREDPQHLTPNGKRYELVEATVSPDENVADDQPEHPRVLRTVEDYAKAPEGTIVAKPEYIAVTKNRGEWIGMRIVRTDSSMAENGPWEVLRWGWGE